jgi:hypothetical protein
MSMDANAHSQLIHGNRRFKICLENSLGLQLPQTARERPIQPVRRPGRSRGAEPDADGLPGPSGQHAQAFDIGERRLPGRLVARARAGRAGSPEAAAGDHTRLPPSFMPSCSQMIWISGARTTTRTTRTGYSF